MIPKAALAIIALPSSDAGENACGTTLLDAKHQWDFLSDFCWGSPKTEGRIPTKYKAFPTGGHTHCVSLSNVKSCRLNEPNRATNKRRS